MVQLGRLSCFSNGQKKKKQDLHLEWSGMSMLCLHSGLAEVLYSLARKKTSAVMLVVLAYML